MYYAIAQFSSAHQFSEVYAVHPTFSPFFYGPVSLPLLSPFAHLSYPVVKFIWISMNTLAFVGLWYGLALLYPFLKKGKSTWAWIFVWAISIKSIHASFQCHNVQLWIVALIVLSEVLSRKYSRGDGIAGFVLAFVGTIKLFPLFLCAFYIARKSKWAICGVLGGLCASALLTLVYLGFPVTTDLYSTFVHNLQNFHNFASLTKDAVTLSLPSLIATWFSPIIGLDASLTVIKIVGAVISIGFFYFVWRQPKDTRDRVRTHTWALAVALMALVNSSTRPDYFVFFIPAFCSLAEIWETQKVSRPFVVGGLVAAALINLISEWILGSRSLNHQLERLRLPVIGMILLCSLLSIALRRRTLTQE